MRIQKGNYKNRVGNNYKDLESEKMGGTFKSGLHEILMDPTPKHQENASKAYLLLTPSVVLDH
jgi:hypothetical protein